MKHVCVYALPLPTRGAWLDLTITGTWCFISLALTKELAFQVDTIPGFAYGEWETRAAGWAGVTPMDLTTSLLEAYEKIEPPPRPEDVVGQSALGTVLAKEVRTGLEDLLRPVKVRDRFFNILGKTPPTEDYVERSHMAGYGVYTDVYQDPILWGDFMNWLKEKGGGDRLSAIKGLMNESD